MPERDPRLEKLQAASLTDAVSWRYGHTAHVLDLVSPTPGRVLFGEVATLPFVPLREDAADRDEHSFAKQVDALGAAGEPGRILVLTSAGRPDAAVAGAIRLTRIARLGFAGVVTTARIRDYDEAADLELGVYCRGEQLKAGSREIMAVPGNVPVTLDDATVLPGDHLYVDRAGAVVVPAGDVEALLGEAVAIEEEDAERAARVRRLL